MDLLRRSRYADPQAAELGAALWWRQGIPGIWVTRSTARGRTWVGSYPAHFEKPGITREERSQTALELAWDYYDEGMEREGELRTGCFRACEVLLRHAARLGSYDAHCSLGYLYSYDRCEGAYWDAVMADDPKVATGCFPADALAVAHYELAADAGLPQACYKPGDLLSQGRGCAHDDAAAFSCYERALQVGPFAGPIVRGSAELRLAQARELGRGCEQSFEAALGHYGSAVRLLEDACRENSWYKGSLKRAKNGLARVRQELSGAY